MREVSYGYCISSMSFQFEKYPNWSGIPTFLCSLIYCVISVWVSAVYEKYVSTPIHPVRISTKNQFPNKPGFPLSALIIFRLLSLRFSVPWFIVWYRFECQRFTQNTFQRLYTPSNFHKKSVPKQTRIPVVHVNNFGLVSLRFSVPWFIV